MIVKIVPLGNTCGQTNPRVLYATIQIAPRIRYDLPPPEGTGAQKGEKWYNDRSSYLKALRIAGCR